MNRYQTFRQTFYDRSCSFDNAQKDARNQIIHDIEIYLKHGLMDDSTYGIVSGPFLGVTPFKIEAWTDKEVEYCQHYEVVRLHFRA